MGGGAATKEKELKIENGKLKIGELPGNAPLPI